jgi:sortase B
MKDNNETGIDETVNNVEEQAPETDALENDGFTEEEVSDAEDAETSGEESSEEQAGETQQESSEVTTTFPEGGAAAGGFKEKLASLTKQQIGTIAVVGVVIIVVIIAILVLATSGKKEDNTVSTNNVSTAVTKSTENATTVEQATTIPVVQAETDVSIEELQQTNEDVYAYIYIPGTEIEYPILQSESKGENYYLNYTINNYYSWTGAIYTQFTYNSKDFSDKNTVIYGHAATRNINSVMFTQLHYYEDVEFLKAYPYVYIYEGDRQLKYQIFAAVHFTDVLIPAKYGVNDGASLVQFVNDAKTTYGGVIDDSVVIDEDSKIITLSTCTMVPNYDDNKRFLVLAKLVEEAVVEK